MQTLISEFVRSHAVIFAEASWSRWSWHRVSNPSLNPAFVQVLEELPELAYMPHWELSHKLNEWHASLAWAGEADL